MRHDNAPDWQDKPETRPFSIELTRENIPSMTLALDIGNVAIALFRKRPELDYIAVRQEKEKDEWTFIFDRHALVYWMGGLALNREAQRTLRLAERQSGSFESHYGWNPDIVIEDYPSQDEVDAYVGYLFHKDLHEDLSQQLKEDLENE